MNTPPSPKTSLDGFHTTQTAQRADELARSFVQAVDTEDYAALDTILDRGFLSYSPDGVRTRTGLKKYLRTLRSSFSDLHFEVHENVGVLVENDLIALRAIVTGTHTGEYAAVPATGKPIQTSVSYIFRFRGDCLVEQWEVMDTYRILVRIGKIPGVAALQQKLLGVPEAPEGIWVEKAGTAFDAPRKGRAISTDESRAVGRRVFDGVINTGLPEDVDAMAVDYTQNNGWTPDGRHHFANGWAAGRSAMPDGLAIQTHVVAENDRVAALSVWDGTLVGAGIPVDFETVDFLRIEDGVAAEHWDSVDYVRLYQSFGLLPQDI